MGREKTSRAMANGGHPGRQRVSLMNQLQPSWKYETCASARRARSWALEVGEGRTGRGGSVTQCGHQKETHCDTQRTLHEVGHAHSGTRLARVILGARGRVGGCGGKGRHPESAPPAQPPQVTPTEKLNVQHIFQTNERNARPPSLVHGRDNSGGVGPTHGPHPCATA